MLERFAEKTQWLVGEPAVDRFLRGLGVELNFEPSAVTPLFARLYLSRLWCRRRCRLTAWKPVLCSETSRTTLRGTTGLRGVC